MLDYLLVGGGLAGIAFAETLTKHDKSFVLIDTSRTNSSRVAAGLYNPIVLKRFTKIWKAEEQLAALPAFYQAIEQKIQVQVDFPLAVLRKLSSIEVQNNWFLAADKPGLSAYLSSSLRKDAFSGIDSPFHFGEVKCTGYVDVPLLVAHYQLYLQKMGCLRKEYFEFTALKLLANSLLYKDIEARHIVFAEGYAMHQNPFFSYLPLDGVKGEILYIKAPNLKLNVLINSSIFIMPVGEDIYKVGATYNWDDKSEQPTEAGKNELLEKLNELLQTDYEVVDHLAGVRPTVKDRKPLVGTHSHHPQVHLLNGLGTRGVLLAPYLSKLLFDHIEYQFPLPAEIAIARYSKAK